MEYSKLDAGLSGALSDGASEQEQFLVSVRTARPPDAAESKEFSQLGGMGAESGLPVLTAKLTREGIEKLSSRPWVRLISLSRRLKAN